MHGYVTEYMSMCTVFFECIRMCVSQLPDTMVQVPYQKPTARPRSSVASQTTTRLGPELSTHAGLNMTSMLYISIAGDIGAVILVANLMDVSAHLRINHRIRHRKGYRFHVSCVHAKRALKDFSTSHACHTDST